MSTTAVPNTHEMVIIHRVFRREFRLLPDLIGHVAVGDTERAALVGEHLTDIVSSLHHHHEGEDDLLWPPLLKQATLEADLIHRMESQHASLSTALDQVDKLTPAWAATANQADRDALATAVRDAAVVLEEHMGEEEQEILPLVREHLTAEQWNKLGERGAKSIDDKRKRLLFLGMILEDCSPAEERDFLKRMPAPVRVLWRLIGRRSYDGYVRLIRR
ncbi:hemerythrin domain-containing protein [Streptomyces sp. SID13031]|uniref:hemerythrin domain-containing protein n=1 Tax=Streptomyces sp. SID13031 TaxID=2706046 RepID=UPI0013CBE761|nr:hemerythrin domain-containing protein [Streptomyces sp. SID13031]NEA30412.1 hemerythrin domain-containing protein [Streptomyces sp. SID13031]